jgi:hypothetical protein
MGKEIAFRGRIRHWREDPPGGLAVVDIPADLVGPLGGRRQHRVRGMLGARHSPAVRCSSPPAASA